MFTDLFISEIGLYLYAKNIFNDILKPYNGRYKC